MQGLVKTIEQLILAQPFSICKIKLNKYDLEGAENIIPLLKIKGIELTEGYKLKKGEYLIEGRFE